MTPITNIHLYRDFFFLMRENGSTNLLQVNFIQLILNINHLITKFKKHQLQLSSHQTPKRDPIRLIWTKGWTNIEKLAPGT